MKEYLFLFRGGDAPNVSAEEIQEHMQKWIVWMQRLGEAGKLVGGLPLQREGKVVRDAGEVITDGPFSEGKEVVGGYMIVKAADLEGATEISTECPIFERGGTVEVRELIPM